VATSAFVALDAGNFAAEVLARDGLTLVECFSDQCLPCKQLARLLMQLSSELPAGVRIATLNVDHNPGLLEQFNVRGVPALLFFKRGALVETRLGVDRKQVLKRAIEAHAAAAVGTSP
jgi:thioredoxin 1